MNLRRLRRAVALALALLGCTLRYGRARLRGPLSLEQRALWLHGAVRSVLDSLGIAVRVEGCPPARGLLVANHLSYLDIAVLGAVAPCFFVARADLRAWPLFGSFARWAGSLFLDRASIASANAVAAEMAARFTLPVPVVLFPEATSTDGSRVLRFHSRLFHPAIDTAAPVTSATLRYTVDDGPQGPVPEREVCFYGDQEMAGRAWRLLGLSRVTAHVRFGEPHLYANSRTAADRTHDEIASTRGDRSEALTG